jgi:hypothetical protein
MECCWEDKGHWSAAQGAKNREKLVDLLFQKDGESNTKHDNDESVKVLEPLTLFALFPAVKEVVLVYHDGGGDDEREGEDKVDTEQNLDYPADPLRFVAL